MKKKLIFILALLAYTSTCAQIVKIDNNVVNAKAISIQGNNSLLLKQIDNFFVDSIKVYSIKNGDSKKTYQYNERGKKTFEQLDTWNKGQWEPKERMSWEYDNEGKTKYYYYEKHDGNGWIGYNRSNWTYDSLNRFSKIVREEFYYDKWIEIEKEDWIYDNFGNEISHVLIHFYDGWLWLKNFEFVNTYDSANNLLRKKSETWKWSPSDVEHGPSKHILIIDSFDIKLNRLSFITKDNGDGYNNDWGVHCRYKYSWTYDEKNNILSEIHETCNDNEFFKDYKHTYSYSPYGKKLSDIYEIGEKNEWVPQNKQNWTYNYKGDTLSYLVENWVNDKWINQSQITWTYNINSKKSYELIEFWQNDKWNNSESLNYAYDSKDSLLVKTSNIWSNDSWVKNRVFSWEYDSVGHNTKYVIQGKTKYTWDTIRIVFKNFNSNISGTYLTRQYSLQWFQDAYQLFPDEEYLWNYNDDGKLIFYKYSKYTLPDYEWPYHEGGWKDGYVTYLSYDQYEYISKHKYQKWTAYNPNEGTDYNTIFSYCYTHDPYGNLLMISSDNGDTTWVERTLSFKDSIGYEYAFDCYKMEIFYTKVTDVEDNIIEQKNNILIFPNPVSQICNLKVYSASYQPVLINFYNILGNKIYSNNAEFHEGDNIIQINTNDFPPGLYSVVIINSNGIKKGIFIKE